jgi:hypothetical protein
MSCNWASVCLGSSAPIGNSSGRPRPCRRRAPPRPASSTNIRRAPRSRFAPSRPGPHRRRSRPPAPRPIPVIPKVSFEFPSCACASVQYRETGPGLPQHLRSLVPALARIVSLDVLDPRQPFSAASAEAPAQQRNALQQTSAKADRHRGLCSSQPRPPRDGHCETRRRGCSPKLSAAASANNRTGYQGGTRERTGALSLPDVLAELESRSDGQAHGVPPVLQ